MTSQTVCLACSSLARQRWFQENPSSTTLLRLVPASLPSGRVTSLGMGFSSHQQQWGRVLQGTEHPPLSADPWLRGQGRDAAAPGAWGYGARVSLSLTRHNAGSARGGTSSPCSVGTQRGHPSPGVVTQAAVGGVQEGDEGSRTSLGAGPVATYPRPAAQGALGP